MNDSFLIILNPQKNQGIKLRDYINVLIHYCRKNDENTSSPKKIIQII